MSVSNPKVELLALATAVPQYQVAQAEFGPLLAQRLQLPEEKRAKLVKIFSHSGIETRYFAVPHRPGDSATPSLYADVITSAFPGTAIRNRVYKEEAPLLATRAAREAMQLWGGPKEGITHVISVSCTGMMAPGLEFLLMNALDLSRQTQRVGLNFMGCFGAIRGLALAKALAAENPIHRVLLVCTELCSLHFQADDAMDTFVANALFADGAAAVVVGANSTASEQAGWEAVACKSHALHDSLHDMTWDSSDHGYVMRLSASVPERLSAIVNPFVEELLSPHCSLDECQFAIHPGGKAILHKVALSLSLQREELAASWEVLRQYGNMSSATVLFVLKALRNHPAKPWAACIAFGPGLSIEGILLRRRDATIHST
jgi:predicted naringenin-chalcone synthase